MKYSLLVVLFLSSFALYAQIDWKAMPQVVVGDEDDEVPGKEVIVTGKITSNKNEPLGSSSISVDYYKYFDYSDDQGKYVLELPPGNYKLIVRRVGMLTQYLNLRVHSGGLLDIMMTEGVMALDEVVVSSRPIDSNIKETIAGISKLSMQEIKTLPTFMGELDIMRSIQTLPGVTSVGEGSSGFNVRGGRVDQNLVLLDGAPIFNSTHALGFVSGYNQDVINNFTLYKGNTPAHFGGRASSVLEVTTRNGDFTKWKYQGGVGLISSRFVAEGPLKKDKTSILLAARSSYANWMLARVRNPDVKNSEVFFYDANLGLTHRFSPNSSLKISAYSSRDFFQFSDQFAFAWENYLASAEWRSFADRKLSPVTLISYGQYKSGLIDPSASEGSELHNKLNYLQLKETVGYIPNEKHTITAGFEMMGYFPKPEEKTFNDPLIQPESVMKNQGVEGGLFVNEEFTINDRLGLSAGLRYSMYSQVGAANVYGYQDPNVRTEKTINDTTAYSKGQFIKSYGGLEPRLSLRIQLAKQQSIKMGYNRMRQYIHLISNTASPTPVDLWQVSTTYMPPQIADNFSFGYFLNLGDNVWETSAEVFYKSMNNLVEYKNFPELYLNPHIETELLRGKGRAYGGELYLRKLKGNWKGWISYTYSQTEVNVPAGTNQETINSGNWYPTNYNKPHTFNLVLNRRGIHPNGGISVTFTYNTGRPFTAVETSYIVGSTSIPVYSDRNKYQIPDYVRMDFSFTIGNIIESIDDSLVFSIYNVFGRENAYSVFYQRAPNFFIPKPYKLSVLGTAMPSLTYNFKF